MTTIAVRDGIIAVDSMYWSNGRPSGYGVKLGRSKDRWWAAGCGEAAVVAGFLDWWGKRTIGKLRPPYKGLPDAWEKSAMTVLAPNGRFYFFEGHVLVPFSCEFVAEGSGGPIALGAMEMGAGAVQSVMAASRHDPSTGGMIYFAKAGAEDFSMTNSATVQRGHA